MTQTGTQTGLIEERHGRQVHLIVDGPTTRYELTRDGELLASAIKPPGASDWTQMLYAPRTGKAQAAGTAQYELTARSWICGRLRPGREW